MRTKLSLDEVHRCFAIRLGIRPNGQSGQVESAGEGLRPRRDSSVLGLSGLGAMDGGGWSEVISGLACHDGGYRQILGMTRGRLSVKIGGRGFRCLRAADTRVRDGCLPHFDVLSLPLLHLSEIELSRCVGRCRPRVWGGNSHHGSAHGEDTDLQKDPLPILRGTGCKTVGRRGRLAERPSFSPSR